MKFSYLLISGCSFVAMGMVARAMQDSSVGCHMFPETQFSFVNRCQRSVKKKSSLF